MNRWSWHVPILLCGIAAVVLPLSGCSRGDNIDLNNLEANHVALNVEGMTWPSGWGAKVRGALEALPWVERGSVKVGKKLVVFKVTDAKEFKLTDAENALKQKGYTATLAKTGSAIPTETGSRADSTGEQYAGEVGPRQVALKVEGMTWAGCSATVQQALASLPWVEKGSVQVSGRFATFKVSDVKRYKLEEALALLKQKKYPATLAKAGAEIPAQWEIGTRPVILAEDRKRRLPPAFAWGQSCSLLLRNQPHQPVTWHLGRATPLSH